MFREMVSRPPAYLPEGASSTLTGGCGLVCLLAHWAVLRLSIRDWNPVETLILKAF